jgi:membrane protease YdiL (CAAX protease family)
MTENMGELKNTQNNNKRYGLTLGLGMLVLFWRVVLPTRVELTVGVGILMLVLDLVLVTFVIILNKNELKEAFSKKFSGKVFLKVILTFVILYVVAVAVAMLFLSSGIEPADPARLVGNELRGIFPLGAIISMVIVAPIMEETVFRMAGRHLLKNGFLFVIISSLLFAFIHTVNFSLTDNLDYFISGVIFSMTYLITKDIRITIGAHFLMNFVGVVMGFLAG